MPTHGLSGTLFALTVPVVGARVFGRVGVSSGTECLGHPLYRRKPVKMTPAKLLPLVLKGALTVARAAVAATRLAHSGIGLVIRVSLRAVGDRLGRKHSQGVFAWCNWFQMTGPNTSGVEAQMVKNQSSGNWPVDLFIGKTVRRHGATVVTGEESSVTPVGTVPRPLPAVLAFGDLHPEPFRERGLRNPQRVPGALIGGVVYEAESLCFSFCGTPPDVAFQGQAPKRDNQGYHTTRVMSSQARA